MSMKRNCILQVEDDENDILLMRLAFKDAGIDNPVHIVTDGEQAIRYLAGMGPFRDRKEYPLPSLVLLDLKLPRKSGFEVLEWIREQPAFKKLLVIVFSSWAAESDVEQASQLGSDALILKPMDIHKYREFARRLKSQWLG
jgi:CheY-like chemotaxis protein